MVSKKITLSILILSTIGSGKFTMTLSDNSYAECYKGKNSEYCYLEFYFIEQLKNSLNKQIDKTRASLLIGITSAILANGYLKNNTNVLGKILNFEPQINLNTIAASLLSLTTFNIYNSYQEAQIKHDILVKFIANWEFHRQYVPTCLIPAFNELANAFNASATKTFSTEDVNAIFTVIQHLLEHEFSSRYTKETKQESNTIDIFKTITEISKNLK